MDFGMPTLLETPNLTKCVELCNYLGLNFIELNMNFPQYQLHNLKVDELKQITKDTGIYFTIHVDENLNVSDFNHFVREAYQKTVEETIKIAKEIGAPIINIHLSKGIYITLPEKKIFLFQEYREHYIQNLLEFRDLCEKTIGDSDLVIAIENTDGFLEYEKEAIELLLQSPCFKLTFDIGHSRTVDDTDEKFYEKHRDKICHMHAHDAKGTANHLPFGEGDIDLITRFQLAKNHHCRVVVETKSVEALKKSIKVLPSYFRIGEIKNVTPVLETKRLVLRPLTTEDAEIIYNNWTSDPLVAKYMIWNLHQSPEETRQWLELEEANVFSGKNYTWAFVLKETGEIIGSGGINYKSDREIYEVGYNIMTKYWNQGYTSEAVEKILDYGTKYLSITEYLGRHAKDNPNSGKVMEKNGFVYQQDGSFSSFDGLRTFESREYILKTKDNF